jgi:cellobiose phosphorylase
MIHYGLFGMNFEPSGIIFKPLLPGRWGSVRVTELQYRNMTLDIRLSGAGTRITNVRLDGAAVEKAYVPSNLKGQHIIEIQFNMAS